MWQVIDKNGVLYSGSESDMKEAYTAMTSDNQFDASLTEVEFKELKSKYPKDSWEGDLKLIQIHNVAMKLHQFTKKDKSEK